MQLTPEQQKAIDAQKEQCPFCKIIKGEIQSKKVYEDEKIIAVLDINPAAKGHLLIMPKEHYPIMPLMPPETFEYLFRKTQSISRSLKEGMLVFGDTLYIANGYAAGQQSSHFMLHLIPREEMDELDFFTVKKGNVPKQKADEAYNALKLILPAMLKQRYMKYPIAGKELPVQQIPAQTIPQQTVVPTPSTVTQSTESPISPTKTYLLKLIENNPQLKEFVIKYPQQFRKQVQDSPKLKKLFENIDIEEIIDHFAPPKKESKYSMNELVGIINDNPKLKELLLKQTFLFTEKVAQIPELKEIFENVDVEELERTVMMKEIKEEQDVKDILGTYAEKIKKEDIEEKEESTEETHLEVPDTENPAPIQEDDSSIEKIEEGDEEKKKENLDLISRLYGEYTEKK
jgi:histidine triad (HIT) family protein